MSVQTIPINLDLAPEKRWLHLQDYQSEIDELLSCYLADLEGADIVFKIIQAYQSILISETYQKEIASIAAISRFSAHEVLIANLYYDILKSYFGCTAFAIDTGKHIFHARNLDWHTRNNILSKYTTIFDFQRQGKTVFKSVGWKGFVGVLSGMKPHQFSVTLNAVLSDDAPSLSYPISFFLRDVLEQCSFYAEAKAQLETKEIASDCLLLLSGVGSGELSVIERTPKRSATRQNKQKHIVVANDYKKLQGTDQNAPSSVLQATSCGRYDRADLLLNQNEVCSMADCMTILQDKQVQMGITVQQMVFDNQNELIRVVQT